MVSGCVAWVKFNGPAEFLACCVKIPVVAIKNECKRVVGFPERAVQFQGFHRRRLRFGECLFGCYDCILPVSQQSISVGRARISLGVFWVLFDRLIEISQSNLQTIRRSLIPEIAPLQIRLVSLRIDNLYVFQGSLFPRSQINPNLIGYSSSYCVLKCQGIAQVTLIALGP